MTFGRLTIYSSEEQKQIAVFADCSTNSRVPYNDKNGLTEFIGTRKIYFSAFFFVDKIDQRLET